MASHIIDLVEQLNSGEVRESSMHKLQPVRKLIGCAGRQEIRLLVKTGLCGPSYLAMGLISRPRGRSPEPFHQGCNHFQDSSVFMRAWERLHLCNHRHPTCDIFLGVEYSHFVVCEQWRERIRIKPQVAPHVQLTPLPGHFNSIF